MKYPLCQEYINFHWINLHEEMEEVVALGIKSVILFGIPAEKDECGTGISMIMELFKKAHVLLKKNYPDYLVVADTCLCEYTGHGHCGVIEDGKVLNDPSLKLT